VNEFHARICEAQSQSSMLRKAQKDFPDFCPSCSFLDFVNKYYNGKPQNPNPVPPPPKKSNDGLIKLILASILGLLLPLLYLLTCCFLLSFCPLGRLLRRRKICPNRADWYVIKDKKSKIFGDPNSIIPNYDSDLIGSGELVRSASVYLSTDPHNLIANAKEKVFAQQFNNLDQKEIYSILFYIFFLIFIIFCNP
jgi:hypothetical protein